MPASPALRVHNRRLRKKNPRFDISSERSLQIDQLILKSTDDEEIRELKQHKRILRNRQAAYEAPGDSVRLGQIIEPLCYNWLANPLCSIDSRYRKKKHIEELEGEKKLYIERNRVLEDEIKKLRMQLENLTVENEELLRKNSQISPEFGRLVETQSEFSSGILLPSTDELSKMMYEIDPNMGNEYVDWAEFTQVDEFAMDSNQQMQMLSET
jgi:hypothetical protein